ncbi:DNA replication/repair protein RecF [Nocardioides sp. ChNu-153]|uniref:DNA replication/repair protein RecF n=1 Tax=unclassified Nocardioides TaxID=2615069 RepID=UPI0024058867|nr:MULTISPECIES: DNA replication/repair protein RecF [unclassified Nocardioides]MDF9717984.1 DNA replication/repair protein RecF [Nocardioides sp. ChNu-99]MDN7123236.1 DNA replication/repair protein RecF [Nocardioides sp. ChNu-153]
MHVAHLSLHDFRSYGTLELPLEAGVGAFLGRNGQGKTNLVEAIDYLSRLSSHRVASDAPLVRHGAERAIVRAAVVRDGRSATLEVEINPGKANRARVNRSALPRARELIGLVRTVVFAPDDLALVKGDPTERRHFLDDLLVLRSPRYAGVRADYDRVLRQRNTLLKTAGGARRGASLDASLATLDVWDSHLVEVGAQLLAARVALVHELRPYLAQAYAAVARGAGRDAADVVYRSSVELPEGEDRPSAASLTEPFLAGLAERRKDELDRGHSLVGPHRDDLLCTLASADVRLPVKGYASHGESWSFALALRLASYDLLRDDGDDPILVLDDVFAELDAGRRDQLAELVAGAEQVLVTAAVAEDVPPALAGARYRVAGGEVHREP